MWRVAPCSVPSVLAVMFFKRPCSIPLLIDTESSLSTSPHALCSWVLQYWWCLLHKYTRTALARTALVLPTIMTKCNTGGFCCTSTHGRLSHRRLSCCPRSRPPAAMPDVEHVTVLAVCQLQPSTSERDLGRAQRGLSLFFFLFVCCKD